MVAGRRAAWYPWRGCCHQLRLLLLLLLLLLRGCCDHDRVAAGANDHVATAAWNNKNRLCSNTCGVYKILSNFEERYKENLLDPSSELI